MNSSPHAPAQRSQLPLLLSLFALVSAALVARQWLWPAGPPAPVPVPQEAVSRIALTPSIETGQNAPTGQDSQFTRLSAEQTQVNFTLPIDTRHPLKYLYFSGTTGGGVAVGDLDNDGWPDLMLLNGPGANKLYRNLGNFRFEDMTSRAGVADENEWGTGVTFADVNNDGRLDIYVCNFDSPNRLFINYGDFRFREEGARYGVNIADASMQGAFADYDRDGDLDLYLVTYRYECPQGRPSQEPIIERNGEKMIDPRYAKYYTLTTDDWHYGPVGRADGLLRNDGADGFRDVSEPSGIRGLGHGQSATWCDFDQDGWTDLYVANDFMDSDQLYHNNGDGTFTDILPQTVPHTTWYSMGADANDVNNDGLMDLLVADMSARSHYRQKVSMGDMGKNKFFLEHAIPRQYMRNALLLNTGTSRMLEGAYLTGLADSDWTWTVKLADFDNDGRCDVYFTNGSPRDFTNSDIPYHGDQLIGKTNWDLYENTPPRKEKNLAFRNRGTLDFEDVSQAWGLDHEGISMAAAHADLDRDGDLDMVVVNVDEPLSIYRNDLPRGQSLQLTLVGRESNRFGVGAQVELQTADGKWLQQLQPATGFLASNEPLVHFGLGTGSSASRVTIRWPNGKRQVLTDLAANHRYVIVEPDADAAPTDAPADPPVAQPWFRDHANLPAASHHEQTFDDYQLQPLLPNRLSQLGPCLATGDADADGDPDLYLGGAAGEPGKLLIQTGPGEWTHQPVPSFAADSACEDLGALWFDVDADGDQDLYVVSGSVEHPVDAAENHDRLYLNDGSLVFRRADATVVPPLPGAGSTVTAADYDRDGDLDLFVGTRYRRGEYPLSGPSALLRNDQGRLVDVGAEKLPESGQLGMVTSALWTDINQDGWIDLLVTREWGSVLCLVNHAGQLSDETAKWGIDQLTGWWNGITAIDVDHDGDLDYALSNFGLNTKYHASAQHPALLYYGDFCGDGRMQLVEAEFEDETLFPVRGKSCSTAAMPHLADKFKTFHSFALASLQDIYTPEKLAKSYRFAATELQSGILINERNTAGSQTSAASDSASPAAGQPSDGSASGQFRFQPLPRIAQIAPGFGLAAWDVDGDRRDDLFMAQNFFSPQHETGRMDGGLSLLLRGSDTGQLEPVGPAQSGLLIPEDAKSCAVLDLDGDRRLDLVVGINNGPARVYTRSPDPNAPADTVFVRLEQSGGNRAAVGARVTASYADQWRVTREVSSGGGYLSQQDVEVVLSNPRDPARKLVELEVVWPDGNTTRHGDIALQDGVWHITKP